jgi:hypothetical protein
MTGVIPLKVKSELFLQRNSKSEAQNPKVILDFVL